MAAKVQGAGRHKSLQDAWEARNAYISGVAFAQGVLPTIIFQARFQLEDVFIFDETRPFYWTGASRALWTRLIKGCKQP